MTYLNDLQSKRKTIEDQVSEEFNERKTSVVTLFRNAFSPLHDSQNDDRHK